jgi:glucose-specific phosphotransferase system IIA component
MFKNLFKRKEDSNGGRVTLDNPVKGKIIKLEEVPDEVFAQKMLGDGFAVDPLEGAVYSPVDGEVKVLFPTLHAVAIETDEGIELLIHIGIDTVELNGEGFSSVIKLGDKVKKGDLLVNFDIETIKKSGKSPITPVIITNMDKVEEINIEYGDKEFGDKAADIKLK